MEKQYYEKLVNLTFMDYLSNSTFFEIPMVFKRAKGIYLWDINEKRYLDCIGGVFVATVGHCHPRLIEAMIRQMEMLTFVPPLHSIADVTLRFIERLGQVTPENLNYIKAFCGGSESIEGALKLTRQFYKQTGKPDKMKCITNYLGYHGGTFGAMSAGASRGKIKFEPQMPGFVKNFNPKQLRDEFPTWEETCRFTARLFEQIVLGENPDTVGAILLEPICNSAGIITPTSEYLQIIRDICNKYDIKLIYDEVLTGFCKTGGMFAAQAFGVTPDIICSGKGMASGMLPAGAFMARDDFAKAFIGPEEADVNFSHGHTFSNFPLANAVAIEAINIMEEQNLAARARELHPKLVARFEKLKEYGVIREVRGKGTLIGVELVEDAKTNKPFPVGNKLGSALKRTAAKNGIVLRTDPDWFSISPPLIITDEQADEMCDLIERSLKDALDMVTKNKK